MINETETDNALPSLEESDRRHLPDGLSKAPGCSADTIHVIRLDDRRIPEESLSQDFRSVAGTPPARAGPQPSDDPVRAATLSQGPKRWKGVPYLHVVSGEPQSDSPRGKHTDPPYGCQ